MNTMTALTIIDESLEETILKMMKANKEECLKNIAIATDKYIKLALNLKNKAYAHIEENKDEVLRTIEFSLKGGN
ncbi:MAG: hypothetical protein PHW89_07910 [Sulfurimonas denitrificans]|nr:hypothetical protein [Sulfurimonas denitrificans]